MKPSEFWNCTYKEINIFCQANLAKVVDNLKRDISLQEAVTNKLIRADSMAKNPKIIPIKDSYRNLFPEAENKCPTPDQITLQMRSMMKN